MIAAITDFILRMDAGWILTDFFNWINSWRAPF